MARVRKQQPKGRIITTRTRSYRNRAGAETVEPEGMSDRSTVVTRRMSMVRESVRRRQRMENETQKRKTPSPIDVELFFFKCALCTGTLRKGMTGFMNHLVEIHYVNPKRYVQHILEKNTIFKEIVTDDPTMTENDLVIGTLGCKEFQGLRAAMMDDKNKTMQCSKARYNLMIEKRHEERQKIGTEISTLFVASPSVSEEASRRTEEQEVEQRSLMSWASKFISKTKSRQWWLGKLPVRGLIDFEGDRENLLNLAKELTAVTELKGEEMRVEDADFWYECKLCIYRGQIGDVYRGSELFAQHIAHDHRISMSFYVSKFIRSQEIFMEHICDKENCGHAGLLQPVNAVEEHDLREI